MADTTTPDPEQRQHVEAVLDFNSGDRVGPYRLLEKIGEGGMGAVFVAEQLEPVRRKVALKVIKLGMDTREVLSRFEAERQALALMTHPNIAAVFDAGATKQGRPYFVMEYVPGLPITDYCDGRRLSIRERIALFRQVCAAIRHAHQKGVIHRDLKPANILVAEHDGEPRVKVIDFGVAKSTQQRLTERTLHTRLGAFIGTPDYTSPEQAERDGLDVDTRTDVYALGVVLYQLLSGCRPFGPEAFAGKSLEEMLRIVCREDPPSPRARFRGQSVSRERIADARASSSRRLLRVLRGDAGAIAMKAIAKQRDDRYDSVADLDRDLERFLDGRSVAARHRSWLYVSRRFVARHRVAIGFSGLALLLVLTVHDFIRAMLDADDVVDQYVEVLSLVDSFESDGAFDRRAFVLDGAQRLNDALGPAGDVGLYSPYEHIIRLAVSWVQRDAELARQLVDMIEEPSFFDNWSTGRTLFDDPRTDPRVRFDLLELKLQLAFASQAYDELVPLAEEQLAMAEESFGMHRSYRWAALGNLARARAFAGDFDAALATLDQLDAMGRDDPEFRAHGHFGLWRYDRAQILARMGRHGEALPILLREWEPLSPEQRRSEPDLRQELAGCLGALGRKAEARELLEDGLRIAEDDGNAEWADKHARLLHSLRSDGEK